jgi:hypothetical protein
MRVDATLLLGVCGFNVPAIALQPFAMISCANCLASASVANLRVPRTHLRSSPAGFGKMFERKETYQISGFFNCLPLGQTPATRSERTADAVPDRCPPHIRTSAAPFFEPRQKFGKGGRSKSRRLPDLRPVVTRATILQRQRSDALRAAQANQAKTSFAERWTGRKRECSPRRSCAKARP